MHYAAYQPPDVFVNVNRNAVQDAGMLVRRCFSASDVVSKPSTFDSILSKALAGPPMPHTQQKPRIVIVAREPDYSTADKSVKIAATEVGLAHPGGAEGKMFATVWTSLFGKGLQSGWLTPHTYEVIASGLNGLESVLKRLMGGSIRAKTMVGRIVDTSGIGNITQ